MTGVLSRSAGASCLSWSPVVVSGTSMSTYVCVWGGGRAAHRWCRCGGSALRVKEGRVGRAGWVSTGATRASRSRRLPAPTEGVLRAPRLLNAPKLQLRRPLLQRAPRLLLRAPRLLLRAPAPADISRVSIGGSHGQYRAGWVSAAPSSAGGRRSGAARCASLGCCLSERSRACSR